MVPPSKKLNDLIRLAELCVDLLQQNEEHYAEVSCDAKETVASDYYEMWCNTYILSCET